ncbi:MAG: SLC13 family permease [Candidatus Limnocylindria bacterium]
MGFEGWLTLLVVIVLVVALAREMAPPAFMILAATILLLLLDVITPEEAFAGFSNEAPIVVAALLIFARAADISGLLPPLLDRFLGRVPGERGLLARITYPITLASGFLNNTTLVAMAIPATIDLCNRRGLSPSRFLMPISYAAVLGGVTTTIGTSTNLTVSGLLREQGLPPLGLFEITPVGLPIALVGTTVLVLLTNRLLPDRSSGEQAPANERDFTVSMLVQRDGPLVGRTVESVGLRQLEGVYLVAIERDGERIAPVSPATELHSRDLLMFVGRVDQIVDLQRMRGLLSTQRRQIKQLEGDRHTFHEVVVGDGFNGQTLRDIGFRARYGAAVLAMHRAGHRIPGKLGEVPLRMGDTLLVLADEGFRERYRNSGDFLVIAPLRGISPTQPRKAKRVGLIGLGFVVATGLGIVSILQGALLVALLLLAVRGLTLRQARDAIDLNIVVLIAAAFGLGAAVDSSGLGRSIADILLGVFLPFGLVGALAGVLLATMAMTELISNNAAAVLLFPVATATAAATGTDPRPFIVAVTLGASLSFLTPLGYQTNLMVYGIGQYRFSDFARLGIPLNLVSVVLSLVLIPIFFPF